MSKKILFDPTKPFGEIKGALENHSSAAYEQNGCVFNRNHKHLNTEFQPAAALTDQQAANAELLSDLNKDLQKVTELLGVVGPKVSDGTATAIEKTKHTKATRRHLELVNEIDALDEE